jgi:hypothetical protein
VHVRAVIETQYPAGETGFSAGAEGATAPETLRQKDRWVDDTLESSGMRARVSLTEGASSPAYFRRSEISQVP